MCLPSPGSVRNIRPRAQQEEGRQPHSMYEGPAQRRSQALANAAVGDFVRDKLEKGDHFFGQLAPNLFAYQHVFELVSQSSTT